MFTNPSSVFIRSNHELLRSFRALASHWPCDHASRPSGGSGTSERENGESCLMKSPSVLPVTISKLVATEPESWQSSEQDPWANELPAMKRVILLNT